MAYPRPIPPNHRPHRQRDEDDSFDDHTFHSSFSSNPLSEMEAKMEAEIQRTAMQLEQMTEQPDQYKPQIVSPAASNRRGLSQTMKLPHTQSTKTIPLSHSDSIQSLASEGSDMLLEVPDHVNIGIVQPSPPTNFPPSTSHDPVTSTPHRRRESRFLSTAAALDAQSEAAILTPSRAHRRNISASLAASLLRTPGVSLIDSLTIPAPASGFGLLDAALARKKKKLLDILNGQGQTHSLTPSPPPAASTPSSSIRLPLPPPEFSDEEDEDAAPKYSYLIDDPETKAMEQAKVERLLRIHRGNMQKSVPLSVQLSLARLHYEQHLGNFKPSCTDYAHSRAAAKAASLSNSGAQTTRTSRNASKTHLLSVPISQSTLSSPRQSDSSSQLFNLGGGGSNVSSASNLSIPNSTTSTNFSQKIKKITFLTQSLSDSSLTLPAGWEGRSPMASINDPMAKSPSRSYLIFPYSDRFDTGEVQLLNQEMMGKFGNESIANAVPASTLKSASVTATLYRTPRDHTNPFTESLKKLKQVNSDYPGPGAIFGNSDIHDQTDSSGSAFAMTSDRLTGGHADDSRKNFLLGSRTPGPSDYDLQKDRTLSKGVHSRSVGLLPPQMQPEYTNAPTMGDKLVQLASKRHRNKLDVELARFSSKFKEGLKDAQRAAVPAPTAYFPKAPTKNIKGAVALHSPHVPPLQLHPTPGPGEYELLTHAQKIGGGGQAHVLHQSIAGSLTTAGQAANFVGFGSSSSRSVLTRAERLIDFHPMPKLTQRDLALIKADERGMMALPPPDAATTNISPPPATTDAAASPAAGAVPAPSVVEIADTLSRSRFGRLHLPAPPKAKKLVTLRPPDIVPKFVIPRVVMASQDPEVKLAWLRTRARSNNQKRMAHYETSREILTQRRAKFLLLQDRDRKIAEKNQLKITQTRWLVLLVHGLVFSTYRKKHEQSHRSSEMLKAALVLQYYWRFKMQRLFASQRFQILFRKLRKSFGMFVINFRIRRKKRKLGLIIRFLQDYGSDTGTKKLLNIVQRFKHCIRVIQRFMRMGLRKLHATIDCTVKQMIRMEEQENKRLAASAAHAILHKKTSVISRCTSVREVLLAELQEAREQWEQDQRAAAAAAAAAAPTVTGKGGANRASFLKKAVHTMQGVKMLAGGKSLAGGESQDAHPPTSSHKPLQHSSSAVITSEQLTSGSGMLVRDARLGRAKMMPLFQAAIKHGHPLPEILESAPRPKALAITSLAEYGLHLSDAIRRAVAVEACRLRRRKHWASIHAHADAMKRYLTRDGSALHNGIELARVLLTGVSARIDADRTTFLHKYPPPFVRCMFLKDELKDLLYDAYLLQAHADEERTQAREAIHPRQHTHQPVVHTGPKFQPGLVTLPIRVLVHRAPLPPESAEVVAKIGTSIPQMLHILQVAGANIGLGLTVTNANSNPISMVSANTSATVPSQSQPPLRDSPSNRSQGGHSNKSVSQPSTSRSRPVSAIGGHHSTAHQPHQSTSNLPHTDQKSSNHPHPHVQFSKGHPSTQMTNASTAAPTADEYDWRSQDVAPVGLLAFHATMAAALRMIGLGTAIHQSSNDPTARAYMASNDRPESSTHTHHPDQSSSVHLAADPYWEVHTHGVLSAIGLHVVRSQALANAHSSLIPFNPGTANPNGSLRRQTTASAASANNLSRHTSSMDLSSTAAVAASFMMNSHSSSSLGRHDSSVDGSERFQIHLNDQPSTITTSSSINQPTLQSSTKQPISK